MPFVIINFALADLIGVGSSVPIAVDLGKGLKREADNIFTCACVLIFASGAATGALIYALAPAIMELMGAEGDFAALAVQYLRVYALCSPVTTIDLRRGQLPAHLRLHPRQHVAEHPHERPRRGAGGCFSWACWTPASGARRWAPA